MQKKAVVLLITLFFITSISVLILKNLDDSNKFIEEVSLDTTLTQIKITDKNVKNEIKNLIKKYPNGEKLDTVLEIASSGVPLEFENIKLFIKIEEYIPSNLNLNNISKYEDLNNGNNNLIIDNILYPNIFIEQLQEYKKRYKQTKQTTIFKSQKQIDYFINEYKRKTNDDKIDNIRYEFGYLNLNNKDNVRYLKCNYNININNTIGISEFIFKAGFDNLEYSSLILL
jgi:hypothetical protein